MVEIKIASVSQSEFLNIHSKLKQSHTHTEVAQVLSCHQWNRNEEAVGTPIMQSTARSGLLWKIEATWSYELSSYNSGLPTCFSQPTFTVYVNIYYARRVCLERAISIAISKNIFLVPIMGLWPQMKMRTKLLISETWNLWRIMELKRHLADIEIFCSTGLEDRPSHESAALS